jgi:hypothetical protein
MVEGSWVICRARDSSRASSLLLPKSQEDDLKQQQPNFTSLPEMHVPRERAYDVFHAAQLLLLLLLPILLQLLLPSVWFSSPALHVVSVVSHMS